MATVGISEVLLLQQRAQWLSTWVLPHEQSLRRWLEQKRMRGVDVDDVIQETYVTLSRLESVAGIRNPKAYVYQTARSLALVCLRRARVLSIQPIADIDGIVGEGIASPEQIVADRQELTRAAAALAGLPDRCREVFVLRKIHGLSQREVAAQLAITEGTVEKQVHKALQRLIDLLGRGGKSAARASNARTTANDQEIWNE